MSFTQQNHQGLLFHTSDAITRVGNIPHAFSTRLGGVSCAPFDTLNLGRSRGDVEADVRENYRRLGVAIGAPQAKLVMCRQVHSDTIFCASARHALPDLYEHTPLEGDGMITNVAGLALTVFYADCIPVLLYDPKQRVIGAVHSGWRGTARGIAAKAAQMMCAHYGSQPQDILAAIGPGICKDCFETHADVPEAMRALRGAQGESFITPLPPEKFNVDLKAMIAADLQQAGLLAAHIDELGICTACNPARYWSHRSLGEARGNHAAVIVLPPAP